MASWDTIREQPDLVSDIGLVHGQAGPQIRVCHCVVSLNKAHLSLLSTGSTQEDPSRHN